MPKTPRVVTFGGGSGAPIIIQSLSLAGIKNISAVSASMDSGGKTGHLRSDERDRVIAASDLLRNLLALINPRDNHKNGVAAFTDLISFIDGRNRNLGYTIYYALLEKYGNNFLAVQKHLETMLGIRFNGTAIPVTLDPTHIAFSTQNGQIYHGEHELDRLSMSANTITKIWLDSPAAATPRAIQAINQATHLIFCPGSIYGSILANFLPTGIVPALKRSKAKKILITNLVTDRNQTHRFTPLDFYRLMARYTKLSRPIDIIISPHISQTGFESKYPQIAASYAAEHSHFLGWEPTAFSPLEKSGVQVIHSSIWSITPTLSRIRHDPRKLARIFRPILL